MDKEKIKNGILIAAIAAFLLTLVYLGRKKYLNSIAAPIKQADSLKTPGIKKLTDGYLTTNAFTKKEQFHPFMAPAEANKIAEQIKTLDKAKPKSVAEGGTLAALDAYAKKWKELNNLLLNSFYRYRDGIVQKMSDTEINQILSFEATFNGIYY